MSDSPFSVSKEAIEAISRRLRLDGHHTSNMGVLIFPKSKFSFPEDELWFVSRGRPISCNWNFPWAAITGRPGAPDDPSPRPPFDFPEGWCKTTTQNDYLSVAQGMAVIEGNLCVSVDPEKMKSEEWHKLVFLLNTLEGATTTSYADDQTIEKFRRKLGILDRLKARDESIVSDIEKDQDFAELTKIVNVSVHIMPDIMEMFPASAPEPESTPTMTM